MKPYPTSVDPGIYVVAIGYVNQLLLDVELRLPTTDRDELTLRMAHAIARVIEDELAAIRQMVQR
jgi:hypothetical protein